MIAALSSGVPPTSVYLVFDEAIARTAASHTFGGVSKSGSPEVRPMMSRPAARSSRVRWLAMELGDGLMRLRRSAIMLIMRSLLLTAIHLHLQCVRVGKE